MRTRREEGPHGQGPHEAGSESRRYLEDHKQPSRCFKQRSDMTAITSQKDCLDGLCQTDWKGQARRQGGWFTARLTVACTFVWGSSGGGEMTAELTRREVQEDWGRQVRGHAHGQFQPLGKGYCCPSASPVSGMELHSAGILQKEACGSPFSSSVQFGERSNTWNTAEKN